MEEEKKWQKLSSAKVTFLVTFYAQPQLLEVCLDSIRKYYPHNPIIIGQQVGDKPIDLVLDDNITVIYHDMSAKTWVYAAIGLAEVCDTDIAVYIEHDAFLLRNIDDMFKKIEDGEYDAVGVEEIIPSPGLNRNSPGMMNQNFFIINMKKMKEIGLDKMKIDHSKLYLPLKNKESGYGISQSLEKKLFLPVKDSGYACGTYYGDMAHHLWYGSYPKRNIEYDNINRLWLKEAVDKLIRDYWKNEIRSSDNLL